MRPTVPAASLALLGLLLVGCAARPAPPPLDDARKTAAKSLWAVVPNPPRYKKNLDWRDIAGSAVAVAPTTLVAACTVVEGPRRIGLVRHGKVRAARITARDGNGLCLLAVDEGPLNLPPARRDPETLRPGEPVFAIRSVSNADYRLAPGRVGATGAAPLLATSVALDKGAILFDAYGALIGAVAGPDGGALALTDALAPATLAPSGLGPVLPWLLPPGAGEGRTRLFRDDPDRDDGPAAPPAAVVARGETVPGMTVGAGDDGAAGGAGGGNAAGGSGNDATASPSGAGAAGAGSNAPGHAPSTASSGRGGSKASRTAETIASGARSLRERIGSGIDRLRDRLGGRAGKSGGGKGRDKDGGKGRDKDGDKGRDRGKKGGKERD